MRSSPVLDGLKIPSRAVGAEDGVVLGRQKAKCPQAELVDGELLVLLPPVGGESAG